MDCVGPHADILGLLAIFQLFLSEGVSIVTDTDLSYW